MNGYSNSGKICRLRQRSHRYPQRQKGCQPPTMKIKRNRNDEAYANFYESWVAQRMKVICHQVPVADYGGGWRGRSPTSSSTAYHQHQLARLNERINELRHKYSEPASTPQTDIKSAIASIGIIAPGCWITREASKLPKVAASSAVAPARRRLI